MGDSGGAEDVKNGGRHVYERNPVCTPHCRSWTLRIIHAFFGSMIRHVRQMGRVRTAGVATPLTPCHSTFGTPEVFVHAPVEIR